MAPQDAVLAVGGGGGMHASLTLRALPAEHMLLTVNYNVVHVPYPQPVVTRCPLGKYIDQGGCRRCGQCKGRQPCDNWTGDCVRGCEPGWYGQKCHQRETTYEKPDTPFRITCPTGQYIHHKSCRRCGQCKDGYPCDTQTGNCRWGCEPGWYGRKCQQRVTRVVAKPEPRYHVRTCPLGYYIFRKGIKKCGQCKNREPCDKQTGYCIRGCATGWYGQRCEQRGECTVL
eukprot:XP_014771587.1 PREDICTED: scavenger receptor class F member 1-like [Octopus bimaculoides]